MTAPKLHASEADIDLALVTRLVAAQCPEWAGLPLRPIAALGTVHVLYRLGDDMVVRLPRQGVPTEEIAKEHHWLPRLAPGLPVRIPHPLFRGQPSADYPHIWSVYTWLDGQPPEPDALTDASGLARDLAAVVGALRRLDPAGAPASDRGRRTLEGMDASARAAIAESAALELLDAAAVTRAWEAARAAPAWDGQAVWVHADLMPGNLLIRGGRLSGVIDFGSLGTGDPASDLNVAWSVLPAPAREDFRRALRADDATWDRARGLALVIALQALPYYLHSHPAFAAIARRTIREVLADHTA